MKPLKIAIIGAGLAGLSCALECEKLGVIAELFERHNTVGWIWPSVSSWPTVLSRKYDNDPVKYLKDTYDINLKPIVDERTYIMKSPNAEAKIEGNLGISLVRGKSVDSIENQLLRELKKTTVHYNSLANYRGSGYARVSPFSGTEALISLYVIDKGDFNTLQLNINQRFELFLEKEKLDKLELMYRVIKPHFSTGRVSKFSSGNLFLAGRSAGLIDRVLGTGAIECIISGVLAARSIIKDEDYDILMKPLQEHIENISVFRNHMENFDNNDFDRLIKLIGTPGIKQLLYNTSINFTDLGGNILRELSLKY